MTSQATQPDPRSEEFLGRMIGAAAGAVTIRLCAIGDQLGLFKDLVRNGPASSAELG